jgi:hypothetical protein
VSAKRITNIKLRWFVPLFAIFLIAGVSLLKPYRANSEGYNQQTNQQVAGDEVAAPIPVVKSPAGSQSTDVSANNSAASVLGDVSYDLSTTRAGVYSGPGNISGHTKFEAWLGKPVPYATDYIDYKGGWTKDFHDSSLWLMGPWGKWVSQGGRRLVLGVPMLENANAGQFDRGISGEFDSYFRNLAGELIANNLGNSIIRLGYEANCNTIGPWQATDNPGGYKLLFRHEVSVMRSVPGAGFAFDWTLCNGLQNGHALTSFDSFYPGNDVVDIIGMDLYDVKWQNPGASPQNRWNYIMSRQMGFSSLAAYASAHGKPLSIPEWGLYRPGDSFAGGGDNTYFIQKMAELITETKPVYQSYFDLDWGGGVLSDFPQGQSAYKQIFGQ